VDLSISRGHEEKIRSYLLKAACVKWASLSHTTLLVVGVSTCIDFLNLVDSYQRLVLFLWGPAALLLKWYYFYSLTSVI